MRERAEIVLIAFSRLPLAQFIHFRSSRANESFDTLSDSPFRDRLVIESIHSGDRGIEVIVGTMTRCYLGFSFGKGTAVDRAEAMQALHNQGLNDAQIDDLLAKHRAKAGIKEQSAAARPLTVGKVVIAVVLGNIATAFVGAALYELLKLLGA